MAYGFGIVGAGVISAFHARALGMVDGARLIGVTDAVPQAVAAFATKHGCKAYPDLAAMLQDDEVAAVIICTPSGAHLEPALQAIAARRHVVVEKPLEITLERCDRIAEAAARAGVQATCIFQSRTLSAAQAIKGAINAGRFGRLTMADAYVKWFRTQQYYDSGAWRGTWKLDGGGALMNQSIHAIDLLQWFLGPVAEVTAFTATLGHERIEVEDVAVAALRFENGALGTIEGSTAVYPGFLKRIEISGMAGTAVLEEETLRLWQFAAEEAGDAALRAELGGGGGGSGAADPAAIDVRPHAAQLRNFVAALQGREPLLVSVAEARKSIAIIHAIYDSARTGKPVKLAG